MDTFHCAECNEPIADTANYCPICGIAKTLLEPQTDEQWLTIRRSTTWHKEVAPTSSPSCKITPAYVEYMEAHTLPDTTHAYHLDKSSHLSYFW